MHISEITARDAQRRVHGLYFGCCLVYATAHPMVIYIEDLGDAGYPAKDDVVATSGVAGLRRGNERGHLQPDEENGKHGREATGDLLLAESPGIESQSAIGLGRDRELGDQFLEHNIIILQQDHKGYRERVLVYSSYVAR